MTVALVDGDVACYLACKPRTKTTETGQYEMLENGDKKPLYSEAEDEAYFDKCWVEFEKIITDLRETLFTDYYKMAVKGDNNFRDVIFPAYKAHRHTDPNKHNKFVPMLRHKAVTEGLAVYAEGMEADDFLRIWAEEARSQGMPFIVCSIDKDLKCIEGTHFNMKQNKIFAVDGAYAMRFFYEQLLQGDPTDGIKGIPGIGPIKARNILEGLSTESEFQFTVAMFYFEFFAEKWKEELILNGRLIYLLKTKDDIFSIADWSLPDGLPDGLSEPIMAVGGLYGLTTHTSQTLEVSQLLLGTDTIECNNVNYSTPAVTSPKPKFKVPS